MPKRPRGVCPKCGGTGVLDACDNPPGPGRVAVKTCSHCPLILEGLDAAVVEYKGPRPWRNRKPKTR